jgi:hypothetical protein
MKTTLIAACAAALALGFAATALAQEGGAPAATETTTPPATEQTEQPATTEQTQAAVEPQAATTPDSAVATAPVSPASSIVGAPPEGKGQIVFFRPNRFVGAALSFTVRENDVPLGRLPNGRYFVHVAEPGIHEYEVGRNDTMRIEIEPGETYYVQQNISMGIIAGRAVLAPSDQATFETAAERMRVSEPIEQQASN